jgi:exopolysaccharide biosynthesis polyprenyl glycosylphosphotransferase
MKKRDSLDVMFSSMALLADAAAIFGGLIFATWARFSSGWIPLRHAPPDNLYHTYSIGAAVATLVYIFVFQYKNLYSRPQTGSFVDKIPRIIKSTAIGTLITAVFAFSLQNDADFSRIVIGISFFSVSFFVLLQRYIMFRIEWNMARHSSQKSNILILGTDGVALHVTHTLHNEPMLRTKVIGFLRTDDSQPNQGIPPESILGTITDLAQTIKAKDVDEIILTDSSIKHDRIVEILLLCEHNLVTFKMVPDLFRIMTTSMDVQSLDDIPLLGISTWPLDKFWNRVMKRTEDILGALVGLIISAPIIAIAAILIRRSSSGPIFYCQERCGENGKAFTIYKLRTMHTDAETHSGPVWTTENDSRRTAVGAFLRRCNLDELPQFWNVLRGDMSLVGPRPERPHFVEQFKEDIGRYMWRHVSKPGLTGWAQVNGLRGNTDLTERIKYDLFYLENWSLAFDFKILVKTLFASKNAY